MPTRPDNPDACLVQVFARAPVAGAVKTRLIPPLGAHGAARLQERLTRFTLEQVCAAQLGPVQLWCTPETGHPFFAACRRDYPLSLHRQPEGDLGERMRHALQHAIDLGAAQALLVGTDCPARTPQELRAACAALHNGATLVLGPVRDGGYSLIGVRHAVPDVFTDIPWGSAEVFDRTRRRAAGLGLRTAVLAPSRDVDLPADLDYLAAQPRLCALLAELDHALPTASR